MSLRDYEGDMPTPHCPEKEYQENLREEYNHIKKNYGKEAANEFKGIEEKSKQGHLEKISKSSGSTRNTTDIIRFEMFKESLWRRASLYRSCLKNNQ